MTTTGRTAATLSEALFITFCRLATPATWTWEHQQRLDRDRRARGQAWHVGLGPNDRTPAATRPCTTSPCVCPDHRPASS